jgi:hypothetical protein
MGDALGVALGGVLCVRDSGRKVPAALRTTETMVTWREEFPHSPIQLLQVVNINLFTTICGENYIR